MSEFVEVINQDGVTVVRLNRPKVNALSLGLLAEIEQVASDISSLESKAVVIWGGPKVFAAGADISEFGGPNEAHKIGDSFRRAFDAVAAIPCVTIAAVSGYALGGGCELAMACDLRIATQNAIFGQPEILLGIIPGAGGTQRLARLVGISRAKELIFSGRQVDAQEALRIGLINRIAEADILVSATTWAREFAAGATVAQRLAKQSIDYGAQTSLSMGLSYEHEMFVEVFNSSDAQIGVKNFLDGNHAPAGFLGK